MARARANGEGGLSWDEKRQRWVAAVTIGYDDQGKRVLRRRLAKTRPRARDLLRELVAEVNAGLDVKESTITVEEAIDDCLAYGLPRRSAKTIRKLRTLCQRHLVPRLGARRLRDLTARDVERCLAGLSGQLSTNTLGQLHSCLNRAVRRAMSRELAARNVVELVDIPRGRDGRQSRSLSPEQVEISFWSSLEAIECMPTS